MTLLGCLHAGFTLGKGTAMWRAFLEQAARVQLADLTAQLTEVPPENATPGGEPSSSAAYRASDACANDANRQDDTQLRAALKARLNHVT